MLTVAQPLTQSSQISMSLYKDDDDEAEPATSSSEISALQGPNPKPTINLADLSQKDAKLARVLRQVRGEEKRLDGSTTAGSTLSSLSLSKSEVSGKTSGTPCSAPDVLEAVARVKALRLTSNTGTSPDQAPQKPVEEPKGDCQKSKPTNRSLLPAFVSLVE